MDKHKLLYPPIPVCDDKKKNLILGVMNNTCTDGLKLIYINDKFEDESVTIEFLPIQNIVPFFNDYASFRNVKAVFFNVFAFVHPDYPNNVSFRQMLAEVLRKFKIPFQFTNHNDSMTSILAVTNVSSKPGEIVISLFINGNNVDATQLCYTNDGYVVNSDRIFICSNQNANDLRNDILGSWDPKHIVAAVEPDFLSAITMTYLQNSVLPSKHIKVMDQQGSFAPIAKEMFMRMVDPSFNKFHVIPVCWDEYVVTNGANLADAVIHTDPMERLPLENSTVVRKTKKPYYIALVTSPHDSVGKVDLLKGKCHRIKLSLVIDENSLPYLYQEYVMISKIEASPKKLTSKSGLDFPVIGFFDNSSVICVRDENGYGKYGKDLFFSFQQEKPEVVTDINKVNVKDTFMVYDILKILSMPTGNITNDLEWGFKITSDAQHPVLFEFNNLEGNRKSSTPVFLMALLLKKHIKAIKTETGKKPNKLGFCIFDELNAMERKRAENGIGEACELMKIECHFVKF